MTVLQQVDCPVPPGLPVLHFHGTADGIVSYQGTFGIPPVEATVQWWADKNQCDQSPEITALPNTVIEDSCTVDRLRYANGVNGSEVTLYRINNGGHTWPGAIPIPLFGFTDQDISASAIIWNFFRSYCPAITSIEERASSSTSMRPNPAHDRVELSFVTDIDDRVRVELVDQTGRIIGTLPSHALSARSLELDLSHVTPGAYVLRIAQSTQVVGHAQLIVQ